MLYGRKVDASVSSSAQHFVVVTSTSGIKNQLQWTRSAGRLNLRNAKVFITVLYNIIGRDLTAVANLICVRVYRNKRECFHISAKGLFLIIVTIWAEAF